ncbi:hypothetical protein MTYP_02236 [Methylophilaceae bacterium]|nr:hypothetical protein MTYP_02236 [Methylophilaceae bacterium]
MKFDFTQFKRTAGSIAVLAFINAQVPGYSFAEEADNKGASAPAAQNQAETAAEPESGVARTEGPAIDLGTVTVQGRNLLPTYVDNVPGGTSISSKQELEKGTLTSIPDALKYQAGVYAPSSDGREGARYSMRGSGIIRGANAWHTGIQFLLDGIPLTTAEGYPFQYAEPLFYNYIEVLRGANGFEYGATTAGGSINFVPHSGYNSSPFQVRHTFGSWNTNKTQISTGGVKGPLDYYVSATTYHTDGFRDRSGWDSHRLFANVGAQLTDDLNTRFYFEYGYEDFKNTANLLLKDALKNPKVNGTYNAATGKYTELTTNRYDKLFVLLGNKTSYNIDDDSSIEGGVLLKYFPLINNNDNPAAATTYTRYRIFDVAYSSAYKRQDEVLGGRQNNLKIGVIGNYIFEPSYSDTYGRWTGLKTQEASFEGSLDTQFIVQNEIEAFDNFWLTTGVAATWQRRYIDIKAPAAASNEDLDQNFFHLLPKLAVRYDINPKFQIYANYGKTTELPLPHNYMRSAGGVYVGNWDVGPQIANSFEVGTRGEAGISRWNITAYRQVIDDEILQVQLTPATPVLPATSRMANADSDTIHQGIEASLDIALWRSSDGGTPWRSGAHGVTLRQAFTFSDFKFDNSRQFGDNSLPGIPRRFYQAGLNYEHPSGFYAGVDGEYASDYAADFANSIHAPSYTVWGAKLGYVKPGKNNTYRVFVEGRNLGDKRYVTSVTPTFDANGLYDRAAVFAPGVGRNVTFGFEYNY